MDPSPEFYRYLHALIFTSIFGVIGLNSLLLYLVIRNRVFVHYCILVFGLAFHTSLPVLEDYSPQFFNQVSVITAMITVLGSLLFIRSFIGIDVNEYIKWNKIFKILAALTLIIIAIQSINILFFNNESFSYSLAPYAALLTLIAMFLNLVASLALWKKERLARLYFLINIPMLVAAVAYTVIWYLQNAGHVGSVSSLRFFVSGGMTLQMILFAVFVGLKIKNFQKEKLTLEQDLNRKLTLEVENQTRSLREAVEEVNDQKEKLKETNALKNKLFSLVAHDLRVPLNNLSGFVQLLDMDKIDREKKAFILNKTKVDLLDSITVIDRLLHWSYKQLEGISVNKERLNFDELVQDVMHELESLIENKKVTFNKSFEVSDVSFDGNMLRVIIRNLVSNAIKFSNEGGTIYLRTQMTNDCLQIIVKDEGIGMDPKWYDNLIKHGRPEVKEGTKGEKGKGFGLLITKDFVEMNNGKLICNSEGGVGTSFTIEIPAS